MNLIHDDRYFTKKEILDRAHKYEFPNPLAVEIFLWDCELASHFQSVYEEVILKGGAAVQLHLPLEMQRGSVDIDLLAPVDEIEMIDIIRKVGESIGETVKFKLHEPKEPVLKLPLTTYFANIPTILGLRDRENLEIKIDILLEKLDLPTVWLENVQTFAIEVRKMRCLTIGVLIGDKLLTLAKESIGMALESDYPKQIYDIDTLLTSTEISDKTISEIAASVTKLTEFESGLRDLELSPSEALRDVIVTMDKYSLVDTIGGDQEIKRNIEGFQQFFVSKSQRRPLYGWSSKTLKIKFLATLIHEHINNNLSEADVAEAITKSKDIARKLDMVTGNAVNETRKKLLDLSETKIKYFREFRGKPLGRVFWEIVTQRNLYKVDSLL